MFFLGKKTQTLNFIIWDNVGNIGTVGNIIIHRFGGQDPCWLMLQIPERKRDKEREIKA